VNFARKRLSVPGLLLAAWLLCVPIAGGQSNTRLEGRLEGTVLDESGAVIAGATVILFSDDRVRTAKTNDIGEFAFASLPPDARYIEISSPGFFAASFAVTNEIPKQLTVTLHVGSCTQCVAVTAAIPGEVLAPPQVSYEERSGDVLLSGAVINSSGAPLAHAALTLIQADLNAPLGTWPPDPYRRPSMGERTFKGTVAAEGVSDEKGEFRFTNLKPGRYTLTAIFDHHFSWRTDFWIARENLTRLSRIHIPSSDPQWVQ
jgi:hypothetical protein